MLYIVWSIGEEHWLGLNNMFDLLQRKDYQLRIKMRTYDRVDKTALYDNFYLIDRVILEVMNCTGFKCLMIAF